MNNDCKECPFGNAEKARRVAENLEKQGKANLVSRRIEAVILVSIILVIGLLLFPVHADYDLSTNGTQVGSYADEQACVDAASSMADGSYECRPVTRIEVVTAPPPPPPPPPGPSNCTADWEASLAVAQPTEIVCISDGEYNLTQQQEVIIPSGVTVLAETRGGVKFIGGGKDHGSVMSYAGTGSVVDGIQVLSPTGIAAAAVRISSTGSANRIENCVIMHSGPGSKNSMPLQMSGGAQVVGCAVGGLGRYVASIGTSVAGSVLLQDTILRYQGPVIKSQSEPNACVQVYGKSDVTIRHTACLDTNIPAGTPTDCGDFCIGTNIIDGTQVFADRLLFEGNVATHNISEPPRDRCLHMSSKAPGTAVGIVVRDFFCSHARAAIGVTDAYTGITVERCTSLGPVSDGNLFACQDDAVINWTWENEELAFDVFCKPDEWQSGWCQSGQTLEQYSK